MLSDEIIITQAKIAASTMKRRSPWLDYEEIMQEAITIAYEVLRDELDESKLTKEYGIKAWLSTRIYYRLIDWQRKQKERYYYRRDSEYNFRVVFVSYDERLHEEAVEDKGFWLIEELSDLPVKTYKTTLSPKQVELLSYLGSGMTLSTIALKSDISIETVKTHFKTIRRKLQAKNSTHAVAIAIRTGEIQCSDFL